MLYIAEKESKGTWSSFMEAIGWAEEGLVDPETILKQEKGYDPDRIAERVSVVLGIKREEIFSKGYIWHTPVK